MFTVQGGRHHGLQACGAGSNWKKNQRAARLALAAWAASQTPNLTPEERLLRLYKREAGRLFLRAERHAATRGLNVARDGHLERGGLRLMAVLRGSLANRREQWRRRRWPRLMAVRLMAWRRR